MDFTQLRAWLALPPGGWPPDHYALLGLAPGPLDPAAVESVVLDKMDRLRPHQLRQPELVTEGMNRLAQALVCLTDPVAKAEYDTQFNIPPPAPPPPLPEPQPPAYVVVADPLFEDETFGDFAPPPDPMEMTQLLEVPFTEGLKPPLVPYTVVEWTEEPEEPEEPPDDAVVLPYEVVPDPEPEPPDEFTLDGADRPPDPATRRELYRRLALLRRATRAWDKLRPSLADPTAPLDRPGPVLAFLDAVDEVRPLFASLRGVVGRGGPGWRVELVVSQPLVLATVRMLLPGQRQAVAIDWRRGQTSLAAEATRLRTLARAGRGKPRGRPAGVVLGRWLARTPEVVLVVLAAAAMAVAMARR